MTAEGDNSPEEIEAARNRLLVGLGRSMEQLAPIVERHEKEIAGLVEQVGQLMKHFQGIVEVLRDQYEQISELKKRLGDEESPPFDRDRFSRN